MKPSFSMFITAMLCLTVVYATSKAEQPSCDSSALYTILEKYYEGHPFQYVNLLKNQSSFDLKNFKVEFNTMRNYRVRDKLGHGTFSSVFKARYLPTGRKYAMKQLVHNGIDKIKREVKIMKDVANLPNILPIRDIIRERYNNGVTKTILVFDYFRTPNYMQILPTLTKFEIKSSIYEILRTLHHAHSMGIIHKDIKPLNVLMRPDRLQTRVIDWGLSDYYFPGLEASTAISTLYFNSPDVLLGYKLYDYSIDVWSTGCILGEMIFKVAPFFSARRYTDWTDNMTPEQLMEVDKKRSMEQLEVIAKVLGTLKIKQYFSKFREDMNASRMEGLKDYPERPLSSLINNKNRHLVDSSVIDLLGKMLTIDHTRRITAGEALMHPYFNDVRKDVPSDSPNISGKVKLDSKAKVSSITN